MGRLWRFASSQCLLTLLFSRCVTFGPIQPGLAQTNSRSTRLGGPLCYAFPYAALRCACFYKSFFLATNCCLHFLVRGLLFGIIRCRVQPFSNMCAHAVAL